MLGTTIRYHATHLGTYLFSKIYSQVLQKSMNLWIVEMYEWFYDTTCAVAFIACFGTLFYISIVY